MVSWKLSPTKGETNGFKSVQLKEKKTNRHRVVQTEWESVDLLGEVMLMFVGIIHNKENSDAFWPFKNFHSLSFILGRGMHSSSPAYYKKTEKKSLAGTYYAKLYCLLL